MAKVLTTEARVANFVVDDLRRRRIPVDGLLKQVGLRGPISPIQSTAYRMF